MLRCVSRLVTEPSVFTATVFSRGACWATGQAVRRLVLSIAAAGLAFGFAPVAWAYCSEPDPPSRCSKPEKPEPPTRPYCAATQSCSEWQVSSYNSELDQYRSDRREYESDVEG